MKVFYTVGNEKGDGILLLNCIKNRSFEEMFEYDLTKANVDTWDKVAISAQKNWQPPQPPSNFKSYKPKFGDPP